MSFREIDIFLGTLDENHVNEKQLVASHVFHQYSLTWCVQKRKQIPFDRLIFYLCTDPIVFVTFTAMVISIVSFGYFLQMFERHQNWDFMGIFLNGYCLFLGGPCPYNPTNNAHRLVFALFLFSSSVFVIVLTTMLTRLFTSRIYYAQIDAIDAIFENDFDLVGSRYAFEKMLQQNEVNFLFFSKIQQAIQHLFLVCT